MKAERVQDRIDMFVCLSVVCLVGCVWPRLINFEYSWDHIAYDCKHSCGQLLFITPCNTVYTSLSRSLYASLLRYQSIHLPNYLRPEIYLVV